MAELTHTLTFNLEKPTLLHIMDTLQAICSEFPNIDVNIKKNKSKFGI